MTPDARSLQTLLAWARDRYGFDWTLRAGVLKLIRCYQDRPQDPKPFAGRTALMQQLDQWLLQADRRLLLLSGAAGRGKSALLLHWLQRLITRGSAITPVYLPISIRFNTASEQAGVRLLFAALCDVVSGLTERMPRQSEIGDCIKGIAWAWQQLALRPEQAFLLVVDGLDEAVNQWFLARHLLPRELPANLHVLIAGRRKAGHAGGNTWLEDLGVRLPDGASPVVELDALERDAVAEAVGQAGVPVDQGAGPAFLDALYRLTDGGDPLLLTLWLGEILQRRGDCLDPAALEQLRPGFGELLGLWMQDQQSLWRESGSPIGPHAFRPVMQVLGLAQGPMQLQDLVDVLGCLGSPLGSEPGKLREALDAAHRLVVGDGSGYVLVHPRLAQHFQEELDADPPRRRAVRAAFGEWGARTVLRLNSGKLPADECPAYLLSHYVAAHIHGDGELGWEDLAGQYLALLRQGWPRAWHAREGAWQGYVDDLGRVAQKLHEVHQGCCAAGRAAGMRLAAEVRCALLAATIRSQTTSIPPQLIASLAREAVWSRERAARVARQCEPVERAQALTALSCVAAASGEPWQAQPLLEEALQAALAIEPDCGRAQALTAVAAQLCDDSPLVPRALAAAAAIQDPCGRALALSAVAALLEGEAGHAAVRQALAAAVAIQDDEDRRTALGTVAARLPADSALLREALDVVASTQAESCRGEALDAVAARLPPDSPLWPRVLEAAMALEEAYGRVMALSGAARGLRGESKDAVLQQALEAAAAVKDEESRARALCAVAGQLHGESRRAALRQALEAAAAIDEPTFSYLSLKAVAPHLKGDRVLLQQALEQAQQLAADVCGSYNDEDAHALSAVVAELQGDEPLVHCALEAAAAMELPGRGWALSAVAAQLQGERRRAVLQQALDAAAAIEAPEERMSVLISVAGQLPQEQSLLPRLLDAAGCISDPGRRTSALTAAAACLQGESRRAALQQALQTAACIEDQEMCAWALCAVAEQLQGESRRTVLRHALEAVAALRHEWRRADILGDVVSRADADKELLQQALDVAGGIKDESSRARALRVVTARMRGESAPLQQAPKAAEASQRRAARKLAEAALSQDDAGRTQMRQALEMVAGLHVAAHRAEALHELGAQLREDRVLLSRVLEAAADIDSRCARARVFSAVAAQLQGVSRTTVLQQALDAVAAEIEWQRADVLGEVAVQLQEDSPLLPRVLEMAAAIAAPDIRARALTSVAAQLQGSARRTVLQQGLQAAAAVSVDRGARLDLALQTVRQEPSLLTYELWSRLLGEARLTRPDLLRASGDLTWCACRLTGRTEQAEEIAQAIRDVCEWFP